MMHSSEPTVKPRAMQVFLFLVRLLLLSVGWLVLLIGVAWAFGALWFDFPVSALRRPLAAVFGLSAIAALAFVRPRWRAQLGVAGAIALVAAWWLTIRPSNTRDWQPEVAQAVDGSGRDSDGFGPGVLSLKRKLEHIKPTITGVVTEASQIQSYRARLR
jgi:hypothetical protein